MRPNWSLICHPAAYRCAYHLQLYDPEQVAEFDGFINHSSKGMILFDIGAHFGLFSLASLHYGGPQAQAVAVDPSPTAVRLLAVQAELSQVADRLRIIRASVGDKSGWQKMISVGVLASGFYMAPTNEHPDRDLTQTAAVTLDSLAKDLGMIPTHIKIDVEGCEAAVLRGGRKTLSKPSAPLLFIEIHNEIVRRLGGDPRETLFLLQDFGYRTFSVNDLPINDEQILSEPLIRVIAKKSPA